MNDTTTTFPGSFLVCMSFESDSEGAIKQDIMGFYSSKEDAIKHIQEDIDWRISNYIDMDVIKTKEEAKLGVYSNHRELSFATPSGADTYMYYIHDLTNFGKDWTCPLLDGNNWI